MRFYQSVITFVLTGAMAISALAQTPRQSGHPSMSTDDIIRRKIPARAQAAEAVTELRLWSEAERDDGGNKEMTFKGSDCLFGLPEHSSSHFDHNDDGQIDFLEIQVSCPGKSARLYFSTDRMGFNISPGTYVGAMSPSSVMREGRPGLGLSSELGCSWGTGSFRIYEAVFDQSDNSPALVSFAASFEQSCGSGNKRVRGTFYYNAIPVRPEPQTLPSERKGRPKVSPPR